MDVTHDLALVAVALLLSLMVVQALRGLQSWLEAPAGASLHRLVRRIEDFIAAYDYYEITARAERQSDQPFKYELTVSNRAGELAQTRIQITPGHRGLECRLYGEDEDWLVEQLRLALSDFQPKVRVCTVATA